MLTLNTTHRDAPIPRGPVAINWKLLHASLKELKRRGYPIDSFAHGFRPNEGSGTGPPSAPAEHAAFQMSLYRLKERLLYLFFVPPSANAQASEAWTIDRTAYVHSKQYQRSALHADQSKALTACVQLARSLATTAHLRAGLIHRRLQPDPGEAAHSHVHEQHSESQEMSNMLDDLLHHDDPAGGHHRPFHPHHHPQPGPQEDPLARYDSWYEVLNTSNNPMLTSLEAFLMSKTAAAPQWNALTLKGISAKPTRPTEFVVLVTPSPVPLASSRPQSVLKELFQLISGTLLDADAPLLPAQTQRLRSLLGPIESCAVLGSPAEWYRALTELIPFTPNAKDLVILESAALSLPAFIEVRLLEDQDRLRQKAKGGEKKSKINAVPAQVMLLDSMSHAILPPTVPLLVHLEFIRLRREYIRKSIRREAHLLSLSRMKKLNEDNAIAAAIAYDTQGRRERSGMTRPLISTLQGQHDAPSLLVTCGTLLRREQLAGREPQIDMLPPHLQRLLRTTFTCVSCERSFCDDSRRRVDRESDRSDARHFTDDDDSSDSDESLLNPVEQMQRAAQKINLNAPPALVEKMIFLRGAFRSDLVLTDWDEEPPEAEERGQLPVQSEITLQLQAVSSDSRYVLIGGVGPWLRYKDQVRGMTPAAASDRRRDDPIEWRFCPRCAQAHLRVRQTDSAAALLSEGTMIASGPASSHDKPTPSEICHCFLCINEARAVWERTPLRWLRVKSGLSTEDFVPG